MTYSKKLLHYFYHPKNIGKLKDADGIGEVGNVNCGDVMKIYIKVQKAISGKNKEKEIIKDIKTETMGCAAAIATSSMITELAKGKTLEDAEKLDYYSIADALEGMPPGKLHCSVLATEALKKAIENYRKKKNPKRI